MKKIFGILIIAFFVIFFIVECYGARNLSKKFDELSNTDFEFIGILEYKGREQIEYSYKNGSEEFEIMKNALFELLSRIYPTDYVLKRGEAKIANTITISSKEGVFYKLFFGYAPSVKTIRITIVDKRGSPIDKHYYVENKDAMTFFNCMRQYIRRNVNK
jgi:hypothetical protein